MGTLSSHGVVVRSIRHRINHNKVGGTITYVIAMSFVGALKQLEN